MTSKTAVDVLHAKEITELMERVLNKESMSFGNANAPEPTGMVEYADGQEKLIEILRFKPDVFQKFVPIETLLAAADAQREALLRPPPFVFVNSNRARATARFVLEHVSRLLEEIPYRCRDFDLLPSQRLAIATMATPLPTDLYTECEITRVSMRDLTTKHSRKTGFRSKFSIEANNVPTFSIADLATGAGKTVVALTAALVILRSRWTDLTANYKDILRTRTREPYSGLCRGDTSGTAKLARLVIVYAPGVVVSHWANTARSAAWGFRDVCAPDETLNVVVWTGLGAHHSVQAAYDSGQPTIWVLPLGSASKAVLKASPHIGVAVTIYDELNAKHKSKYVALESPCVYNYVTHATIEALRESTEGDPRHALRLALCGIFKPVTEVSDAIRNARYNDVDLMLDQFCKIQQFALPLFLRRIVSKGVANNLPEGLTVHRLNLRTERLSEMVTGRTLQTVSLADLVDGLLGKQETGSSFGSGGFSSSYAASVECRERFRAILESKQAFGTDEMLAQIRAEIDKLTYTTVVERATRVALERLLSQLRCMFGRDAVNKMTLPDCPVTLEPMQRDEVRILACCTGFISKGVVDNLHQCPLCRAPLTCVGTLDDEAPSGAPPDDSCDPYELKRRLNTTGAQPQAQLSDKLASAVACIDEMHEIDAKLALLRTPDAVPDDESDSDSSSDELRERRRGGGGRAAKRTRTAVSAPDATETENKLLARKFECETRVFEVEAERVSKQRLGALRGVVSIIRLQTKTRPSARILVCFGYSSGRDTIRSLMDTLREELPNASVYDVNALMGNIEESDVAQVRFADDITHPGPVVMVLNTSASVSNVQGMDLWRTDLTVMLANCSFAVQKQAIGRSLRMRPRPPTMSADERFAPKRLVVAHLVNDSQSSRSAEDSAESSAAR